MQKLEQLLTLIFSFIVIFLWQATPLSSYTTPILGLLIALYLIVSSRKKGKGFLTMGGGPFGVFVLNTLIFLLIFTTDSFNSPLFFLIYFLGFGIAFVFEPIMTFAFLIGAILVFIPDISKGDLTQNILKLSSVILIAPLAYFFGKEFRKTEEDEQELEELRERSKEAADTISKDIEEVIKNEKSELKDTDLEKLNEVLEETEDLRAEKLK